MTPNCVIPSTPLRAGSSLPLRILPGGSDAAITAQSNSPTIELLKYSVKNNEIQNNEIQNNEIQNNEIQNNEIQNNEIQNNEIRVGGSFEFSQPFRCNCAGVEALYL
jgi:hypothetical protein